MSVSFDNAARGRSGRVPLSLYMPVINNSSQPFYKVMPNNAVPTGTGNQNQQIGYWNEQVRWRTVKGVRKDLPSKWHFYYLGTGPHAELKYRTRQQGVFWVAREGAKTQPTGLGTRSKNAELVFPRFAQKLPGDIEIVQASSRPNSRASSRSRSQSSGNGNRQQSPGYDQRGNRSQSRGRQQNQSQGNQSRNNGGNGQPRNQSRGRSNSRNRNSSNGSTNQQDLVAAVRQALASLGISGNTNNSGTSTPKSGRATPKRSKSPVPEKKNPEQMGKPMWKRTPNSQESADICFGPRSASQNFGDAQLVRLGADYPHYPQIAELIPTQAALLFGSEITAHEAGEHEIEITYVYKMRVPMGHRSLARFLPHIGAYADAVEDVTLDPSTPPFVPLHQRTRRDSIETQADVVVEEDDEQVEEVLDDVHEGETSA
uniref:Nucleoprotein n=1 Tax=Bat Coronavirus PaGD16 TaxID=3018867 RepID=A0AA49EDA9_9NIDO|nr:nucleocapsid phosphoprotein [Bat Coronavirus PaGD16]